MADAATPHLEAAAQLYTKVSPATSAHLMLNAHEHQALANLQSQTSSCKSCGTILIPGFTEQTSLARPGSTKASSGAKKPPHEKPRETNFISSCTKCGHFTSQPVPKKHRAKRTPAAAAVHVSASAEQELKVDGSKSKSRKKRGKGAGLQALLAKAESTNKKPSGLDLMDLMR